MEMTATQPKKGVLASSADFDWGEAAGPMQGATTWTPSENSLASSQLSKILQSDSPLMVAARSGAERAAARRGLLSSSISAGAGQEAMVNTATPIATQDANTWAMSQRDAAQAANDFARDANAFGRQRATETYRGILAREGRDSEQAFTADQNRLGREFQTSERVAGQEFTRGENATNRTFQTNERIAGQDFTRGENQANRTFQTNERIAGQDFTRSENQATREQQARLQTDNQTFTANENRLTRESSSNDAALNRAHNEAMTRLSSQLAQDANRANIPQQLIGTISTQMSEAVRQILSDPNMDGPAKDTAISNYYKYANTQMQWMSNFYGTATPNFMGGANFTPRGSQAATPPASSSIPPLVASPATTRVEPPAQQTGALAQEANAGIIGDGDPRDYAWQRWRQEA